MYIEFSRRCKNTLQSYHVLVSVDLIFFSLRARKFNTLGLLLIQGFGRDSQTLMRVSTTWSPYSKYRILWAHAYDSDSVELGQNPGPCISTGSPGESECRQAVMVMRTLFWNHFALR